MGCHRMTLQRVLKRANTSVRSKYTTLSDDELHGMVERYNSDHPHSGAIEVQGWLRSKGFMVQRKRCRDILKVIDPNGTAIRKSTTIQRRVYHVASANAWWHVDAHCSLDKWGVWIQGCIDGFSRKVIYLHATSTNSMKAAACHYVEGVVRCGVPSRVRTDRGSENQDIMRFMEKVNGDDRASCVQGPSTHNQRIERLWRDVFVKVVEGFYTLFYHMEEHNILNRENAIKMFCLQFVYLPRIDAALQEWMAGWNNRSSQPLRGQSPDCVWQADLERKAQELAGTLAIRNAVNPPVDAIEQAKLELQIPSNDGQFLRPRVASPVDERDLEHIDRLRMSDNKGMDIYGEVYALVQQLQRHV